MVCAAKQRLAGPYIWQCWMPHRMAACRHARAQSARRASISSRSAHTRSWMVRPDCVTWRPCGVRGTSQSLSNGLKSSQPVYNCASQLSRPCCCCCCCNTCIGGKQLALTTFHFKPHLQAGQLAGHKAEEVGGLGHRVHPGGKVPAASPASWVSIRLSGHGMFRTMHWCGAGSAGMLQAHSRHTAGTAGT